MQPWEKQKTVNRNKRKKERRSLKEKLGLAVEGVTLSAVCCSVIYGTLLYEFTKQFILKIDKPQQK